MWPREDWNDTFSCYLPLGGHIVTDLKILRDIIVSFFLYYCTTNLIFLIDMSSLFLLPVMCCTYTYELSAKKIIKFDTDPFLWDVTSVESSDRWNNIFTLINSAISTWMLEEMSRTRSSSARISGNTLRPALAGLWLLLDLRAPSIFFTQE